MAFALLVASHAEAQVYSCPVTFVLEDSRIPPVGIVELDFDVSYGPDDLAFAGSGAAVECVLLAGATSAVFEDDDAGKLAVELDSPTGLSSLITPLARCTTLSAELPTAADLATAVVAQKQAGGADVTPPVPVEMLLPEVDDCELVATTTTTTSTTSSTTSTTTPSTSTTTTTTVPVATCGDPTGDSATTATDALLTLNAAVGLASCALCTCDIDGSTTVTASDALFILNVAVGQPLDSACPPCS